MCVCVSVSDKRSKDSRVTPRVFKVSNWRNGVVGFLLRHGKLREKQVWKGIFGTWFWTCLSVRMPNGCPYINMYSRR